MLASLLAAAQDAAPVVGTPRRGSRVAWGPHVHYNPMAIAQAAHAAAAAAQAAAAPVTNVAGHVASAVGLLPVVQPPKRVPVHLVPCLYDNPFEDLFGDEGLGAVCTLSDELKARVKAAPGTGHDEFELHMRLHEQARARGMAGDGVGGSSTGYEFKPINHKKRALEADEADEEHEVAIRHHRGSGGGRNSAFDTSAAIAASDAAFAEQLVGVVDEAAATPTAFSASPVPAAAAAAAVPVAVPVERVMTQEDLAVVLMVLASRVATSATVGEWGARSVRDVVEGNRVFDRRAAALMAADCHLGRDDLVRVRTELLTEGMTALGAAQHRMARGVRRSDTKALVSALTATLDMRILAVLKDKVAAGSIVLEEGLDTDFQNLLAAFGL